MALSLGLFSPDLALNGLFAPDTTIQGLVDDDFFDQVAGAIIGVAVLVEDDDIASGSGLTISPNIGSLSVTEDADIAVGTGVDITPIPIEVVLGGTVPSILLEASLDPTLIPGSLISSMGAVTGAVPSPVPPSGIGAAQPVVIGESPFDVWYFRIYIFPSPLTPINPRLNTDIAFDVFNAFPFPATNTLTAITGSGLGSAGVTFDQTLPAVFDALEDRTVNLQITDAAGATVNAQFAFTFGSGSSTLLLEVTIFDSVGMFPDDPVQETWTWMTDISKTYDGTEQRMALRSQPRRALQFSFFLDPTERIKQYNRWFKSLATPLVVPFYWYSARLTQNVSAGATQVFFDPARTDLRDGDFIMFADPRTLTSQLSQVNVMQVDGATLKSALTADVTTDMIAAPGILSRLLDQTGFTWKSVSGTITVSAETMGPRTTSFTRPGATPTIATFDGLNVLDKLPINRSSSQETFSSGYQVIQYDTGIEKVDASWKHTEVIMARTFLVKREQIAGEMDYWRGFLDVARGRLVPFLFQTYLSDLTLIEPPVLGGTVLHINGIDYAERYFPFDTFTRLALLTANGLVYVKVSSAVTQPDQSTLLNLSAPLGGSTGDNQINQISFLLKVTLGDDNVQLIHSVATSTVALIMKTVDA